MKTVVVRNVDRTDAELVKRLGALGTSTVHEAYGRIGLMKPYLRPVWAGGEAAGRERTRLDQLDQAGRSRWSWGPGAIRAVRGQTGGAAGSAEPAT